MLIDERPGVEERVRFVGQLPAGEAVAEQLNAADLFLLPSRAEGVPGTLIEARVRALAAKIAQVVMDPGRMNRMSRRNRQTAPGEGVAVHAVPMLRRISPAADVVALSRLLRLFRRLRPHIVHGSTPRAAALSM